MESIKQRQKRLLGRITEAITHSKDGVWLQYFSGLNADHFYVEVWKDGQKIDGQDKYANGVGNASYKAALEVAKEKSEEYGLPIVDGTGAAYFTFPSEYRRNKSSVSPEDLEKYGIEKYEYSDEEIYDMDDREERTAVWARYVAPGQFEGLTIKAKNPSRVYDVRAIRMSSSDYRNQYEDMNKYLEEHADELEPYSWNDIKETKYLILKDGGIYTDKGISQKLKELNKWELGFCPGDKRAQLISNGHYTKRYNDDDEDSNTFAANLENLANVLNIKDGFSSENKMEVYYLISLMEIVGVEVPEEFDILYKDFDFDSDDKIKKASFKKGVRLDKWYDDEGVVRPQVGMIIEIDPEADALGGRSYGRSNRYDGNKFFVVVGNTKSGDFLAVDCTDSEITYKGTWGNDYKLVFDNGKAKKFLDERKLILDRYSSYCNGYYNEFGKEYGRPIKLSKYASIGSGSEYQLSRQSETFMKYAGTVEESKVLNSLKSKFAEALK